MTRKDTREHRFKLASSLNTMQILNKSLEQRQDVRSLIQKSPFSSLLDISEFKMEQSSFFMKKLLDKWVDVDKKFKFGKLGVSVGASEITQILGIKGGETEVDLSESEESIVWKFLVRSFPNQRSYRYKTLLSHLNNEWETILPVDYFRFYLAIAFAAFLFPSSRRIIESRMLPYLDNVNELNKFNWSGAIHKSLMKALKDGQNDVLEKKAPTFKGCSFFLQIWALERTQVSISGMKKSGLPLFLKYKNAIFTPTVANNILAAKGVLEFLPEVSPAEGSSSSAAATAADLCEPVEATSMNEIEGATEAQQIDEVVIKSKDNELQSIKSELEEVQRKAKEKDKLIEEKDLNIYSLREEIDNLVKANELVIQKKESELQRIKSELEEVQKKVREKEKLIAEMETLHKRSTDPSSDLLDDFPKPSKKIRLDETASSFPEQQSSWKKDLSCSKVNAEKANGHAVESVQEVTNSSSSQTHPEEMERNARVNAVWQQMNKGVSKEKLNSIIKKSTSPVNKTLPKISSEVPSANWMSILGLGPKRASSIQQMMPEKRPIVAQNGSSDDLKKLATAALSAVKDAATLAAVSGRGKVEITEVRDFAGEEVEVKKFVDASSKEASEKAKATGAVPSAVDAVLEQIKKKPKLSVLDKTKKDWREFKEENKGLEDELETYKKSGNQYLDKVSFLQRADYREFERESDTRLALQAKRKSEM